MIYDQHHLDADLHAHFHHDDRRQKDLTFALWKPSAGSTRLTAILTSLVLPVAGERLLNGKRR